MLVTVLRKVFRISISGGYPYLGKYFYVAIFFPFMAVFNWGNQYFLQALLKGSPLLPFLEDRVTTTNQKLRVPVRYFGNCVATRISLICEYRYTEIPKAYPSQGANDWEHPLHISIASNDHCYLQRPSGISFTTLGAFSVGPPLWSSETKPPPFLRTGNSSKHQIFEFFWPSTGI